MIILTKKRRNTLTLSLNNNSRSVFTSYTLTFTHISSQLVKSYVVNLSDSNAYGSNDRFCEIVLNLQTAGNDLVYAGQYLLQVYGDGTTLVYTGMVNVKEYVEVEPFVEHISDNEDNENYIYTE